MSQFTLSPSADADIDGISNYIAEDKEEATGKFIRDLVAKFQPLTINQEIGKRQDGFVVEMRLLPFKDYYIYYFPSDDGVEIYRILHGRGNIEELFNDYFDGLKE